MAAVFDYCGKRPLFCYALSCPLSAAASTAFAMSLQPIIDAGLSGGGGALAAATAAAVAIACIDVLLSYIRGVSEKSAVASYTKNLRLHYFELLFRQDIARFLEQDSAAYVSKLTVDAEAVGSKYGGSLLRLYGSLWSLAVSTACIAWAQRELAVYVLIISALSAYLPRLFQKGVNAAERDYLDSSRAHIGAAQESMRNYLVIRLFKLVPSRTDAYRQRVSEVERRDAARQRRAFAVDAAAGAVSCVSFLLIIALCMLFVLRGKLTVGYTLSVSQLLGGVMAPFERLPGYLAACRAGRAIYQSNEAELHRSAGTEGGRTPRLTRTDDRLEMDRVSFAYSAGHPPVLKELSLSLDLKKKYAVVGTSGSGKSTLAKLLMGLLEPDGGCISLNGVPLREIDPGGLYDVIAYQNQTLSFFDGTIKDNILLGKELPESAWRRLLAASRLDDMLSRLPEREFTVIEENGKNISGGEAQRICLARCLAGRPAFLIFDEMTASLDPQNAAAVEQSILSLEHAGVLQITHRMDEETMRQYDAIFVLKDGGISERGTWDELMARRGDFYQLALRSRDPDGKA